MYNSNFRELWRELTRKPHFKRYAILFSVGFILIVAFFFILAITPHTRVSLHNTGYNTDDSHLFISSNNQLLIYQGGAFISHSLDSQNDAEILLAGIKLPELRSVTWAGDKGALITPRSTEPYRLVGTELENIEGESFYIDFESGIVTAIDQSLGETLTYRSNTNSFVGASGNMLRSYDIETGELTQTEHEDVLNIQSLSECGDSFCLVTYAADGYRLHMLEGDELSDALVETDGALTPTNNPLIYAVSEELEDGLDEHALSLQLGETRFYSVATREFSRITTNLEGEDRSFIVRGMSSVAVLESASDRYHSEAITYIGLTQQRTFSLRDGEDLIGVLEGASQADHLGLGFTGSGDILLIAPNNYSGTITQASESTVAGELDTCDALADYEITSGEIRLFAEGDTTEQLTAQFRLIGECLAENSSVFIGYQLQLTGVDSDGRIILI